MNLAVLSESEADEAALRIIGEAILGRQVEWHRGFRRRSRGFGSVPSLLRSALMELHYHSEVDALLVVVDADDTPLHLPEHEPAYDEQKCRLCKLRAIANNVSSRVGPRPNGTTLRTAIGLAAPEIEAWYLCGLEPWATEANWLADLAAGRHGSYRARLKPKAYGVDRASLSLMISKAREHATRLAGDLQQLEANFQNGFGPLAREIRSWLSD
jgi:hypothetical protein